MDDKILIITDDDSLLDALGGHLAQWGGAVLSARGSGEAQRILARERTPLVILDDSPAGDDSLALLSQLRRIHSWAQTVFLAAPRDMERGAKALELGASDFLVKPVSASRLAVALKRAQERLIVNTKLAVLSGEVLDGAPPQQVDAVLRQLDEGAAVASRLYDTQQKYQLLFDAAPCYISVLGQDLRITEINRRFREDFGDLVGEYRYDVYKGGGQGRFHSPVARTFVDGRSHQYEQMVTALSGEQYNVLTWTAPLRDGRGEITRVMEMSTNITQIRQLQDHLASLGMLIGSISHGVKGLITALDGGMYNLRSGFARNDPQRVRKGWEVVELMVGRIRRTVLDVLYYAKERELEMEEVDAAEFAGQVASTFAYAAERHGLDFKSSIGDRLGVFQVDPNALQPALINLLENAVDACLDDRARKDHKIRFSASREDDVIVFDIEDNGMGMDQSTQENMFTLFFTSKGSSGTGLGLFIANDTVLQHGGSIIVDSEPGQGAHFHVRIPERPRTSLED